MVPTPIGADNRRRPTWLERYREQAEGARAGMEQPAPAAARRSDLELDMMAAKLAWLHGTGLGTMWMTLGDRWDAIEAP